MVAGVFIVLIIAGSILGLFYLFITARNKERMSLIDKGAEATIFYSKTKRITPIWKVLVLNLSLLAMGIGLGIFIAGTLHYTLDIKEDIAYPGTIFFMAGAGLFTGFKLTSKLD